MSPMSDWTVVAALHALNGGTISAEALTQQFLFQIEQKNPAINALRTVLSDQALEDARRIDRMRTHGQTLPALAGLPIVIKENCDVAGANCSAGLAFLRDRVAAEDAAVTRMLKQQGAIIVGVSISDPGAFSVRTVEVNHPVDSRLTVGGSSGGSAAALASGMCLGAVGTDTGGSIRIPSASCGTAGLKPSYGALSMDGVFPLVPSLDHVGPMARNVADLTAVWEAMSPTRAKNPRDVACVAYDPRWIEQAEPEVRKCFDLALRQIKSMVVTVRECQLPDLNVVADMHGKIFLVESAAWHEAHYGAHLSDYPEIARQWFALARDMKVEFYVEACMKRKAFKDRVSQILTEVDALMLPTLPISRAEKTASTLNMSGREEDFTMTLVRFTCLFNHTGHPVVTFPFEGASDVLSASLQLVGRYHDEDALLRRADLLGRRDKH